MSHVKSTFYETKYELFKVFCMSVYGSILWDYSSPRVGRFYTTWRKCIRQLFGLPYRAHNWLLHLIFNYISVDRQLHARFLKFMSLSLQSANLHVRLCASLCLSGSRSGACNSINFICSKYNINKYTLSQSSVHVVKLSPTDDTQAQTAGTIRDLLHIDHVGDTEFLPTEVQFMIDSLCLM